MAGKRTFRVLISSQSSGMIFRIAQPIHTTAYAERNTIEICEVACGSKSERKETAFLLKAFINTDQNGQ